MPRGRYRVGGATEDFSCAAGPAGWRYASAAVDLTLDRAGRTVRLQVRCGGREVRGGRTELGVTWLDVSRDPPQERHVEADGFAGVSPALLLAAARRVAGPGEGAASATLRLVHLTPPHLAPLLVTQRWSRREARRHDAPAGSLLVETWEADDLDTGRRRTVHIAGDVVLAADGEPDEVVELEELESPPIGAAAEPSP